MITIQKQNVTNWKAYRKSAADLAAKIKEVKHGNFEIA